MIIANFNRAPGKIYAWQLADEHQLLMPESKTTFDPQPAACSTCGVRELPGDTANPLLHTNHPLGNWWPEAIVPGSRVSESSASRLKALQQEVVADQQIDEEALLALLLRAPLKVTNTSTSAISTFISTTMNLFRGSCLVLAGEEPMRRFRLT